MNEFHGPCPVWEDRPPPGREAEYQDAILRARRRVGRYAPARLPDEKALRHLHRTMFADFVELDCYAGNFRGPADPDRPLAPERCLAENVQVAGVPGADLHQVAGAIDFLCYQIETRVKLLEMQWSGLEPTERVTRLAVSIAEAVGTFIRIHPFLNGNGRTSRLLWQWFCNRFGVPPQVRVAPRPSDATPYATCMAAAMSGDNRSLAVHVLLWLGRYSPEPPKAGCMSGVLARLLPPR